MDALLALPGLVCLTIQIEQDFGIDDAVVTVAVEVILDSPFQAAAFRKSESLIVLVVETPRRAIDIANLRFARFSFVRNSLSGVRTAHCCALTTMPS